MWYWQPQNVFLGCFGVGCRPSNPILVDLCHLGRQLHSCDYRVWQGLTVAEGLECHLQSLDFGWEQDDDDDDDGGGGDDDDDD